MSACAGHLIQACCAQAIRDVLEVLQVDKVNRFDHDLVASTAMQLLELSVSVLFMLLSLWVLLASGLLIRSMALPLSRTGSVRWMWIQTGTMLLRGQSQSQSQS